MNSGAREIRALTPTASQLQLTKACRSSRLGVLVGEPHSRMVALAGKGHPRPASA